MEEHPTRLYYSKPRFAGTPVAFNDVVGVSTVDIVDGGEEITALDNLNGSLVIFKDTSIHIMSGGGPDALGNGSFSPVRLLSSDVGCSDPRTVVRPPRGLMFLSKKGFYLLDLGFNVLYIGAPVEDYNSQTYTSVNVLPDKNEIRFLTSSGDTLMYNHLIDQWGVFTGHEGVGATILNDVYYYAKSDGTVLKEDSVNYQDGSTDFSMAFETSWIKPVPLVFGSRSPTAQGFMRVRRSSFLGETDATNNSFTIQIAYDYNDTYDDSLTWNPPVNLASLDLEASSNQYASISDGSQTGLDLEDDFTLECDVKFESTGGTQTFLSKYGASGQFAYRFYVSGTSLSLGVSANGTTVGTASVTWNYNTFSWYHLAVVRDTSAGTASFYIDGALVGTKTLTGSTLHNSTYEFRLGATSFGQYLDGLISGARVWSVARLGTDISWYRDKVVDSDSSGLEGYWRLNNNYLDETDNDNDLTASGSPVFSTTVPWTQVEQGQIRFRMPRQKCQALKYRVTENVVSPADAGATFAEMMLEIGVKRGINRIKTQGLT
jgi:hypothetical protein